MMMTQQTRQKTLRGFSIGEVLISAFILSVGIVAAFSLMAKNITETSDSRDLVIASQLAQEGAELMHNYRDNNVLIQTEVPIPEGADDPFAFPECSSAAATCTCRIDYLDESASSLKPRLDCGTSDFALDLYPGAQPDSVAFYAHAEGVSGSVATKFQRRLFLDRDRAGTANDYSDDRVVVQSMVVWSRDPGDFPAVSSCTINENCTLAEVVLTGWLNESPD